MKLFVSLCALVFCFASCKQTEQEKEYEALLKGKWIVMEQVNNQTDTMYYEFRDDNTGTTIFYGESDDFGWEVKRKYINTLYKRSPSYYIGYDKYNSKGYYKINSIDNTYMEAVQLYYNGMEITRKFYKVN